MDNRPAPLKEINDAVDDPVPLSPTAGLRAIDDTVRLQRIPAPLLTDVSDPVLDAITATVQKNMGGAAFINVVLQTIQFMKSQAGGPRHFAASRATNRSAGFCQHVVAQGQPLLVEDAHQSPLSPPEVADLDIRTYVGAPITYKGAVLGALCAVNDQPHAYSKSHIAQLEALVPIVNARLATIAATAPTVHPDETPGLERALELLEGLEAFLSEVRPAVQAMSLQLRAPPTLDPISPRQLATDDVIQEVEPLHRILRDAALALREALAGACEVPMRAIDRLVFELRPLARLAEAYEAGAVEFDDAFVNARLLASADDAICALEVEVRVLRRALNRLA